jgi:predicted nucleic acid-binding protein
MVVDSDILIDYSRGVPEAAEFLTENSQVSRLLISSMTQMEVLVGARNKREQTKLSKFLGRFEMIKFSGPIADWALRLLTRYTLSHGLLIPDALIAATALSENQPLATNNRSDYEFITGLRVVSYP